MIPLGVLSQGGPIKVMRAGDSRTEALVLVDPSPASNRYGDRTYALPLLQSAGARFVGRNAYTGLPFNADLACEGYGGYSTFMMESTFFAAMSVNWPDVIVMEIGYNDLCLWHISAANTAANIDLLVRWLYGWKPDLRLVLMNIGPVTANAPAIPSNAQIDACNAIIATNVATLAAEGKHIALVDLNAAIKAIPNWDTDPDVYPPDGLHYRDPIYQAMVSAYWTALLSMINLGPTAGTTPVNLALGKSYNLSPAPHASYPDKGGELTDGIFYPWPDGTFVNIGPYYEASVGWNNQNPTIDALDLGSVQTVSQVLAYWTGGTSETAGVYAPSQVVVSLSTDGVTYTPVSTHAPADVSQWDRHVITPTSARYVRVEATRRAGADVWVMCGEIVVL